MRVSGPCVRRGVPEPCALAQITVESLQISKNKLASGGQAPNINSNMNVHGFLRLTISYLLLIGSAALGQDSVCRAECSLENGFCDENGECRCRPGWRGATCEQCVSFPGCVHGTCEKAWQCICEQGWVGSHCDQEIHLCSSKPCFGNSTCTETGAGGHICTCPPGHTGKNCQLNKGPCLVKDSPCQNGGTCMENSGFDSNSSCLCPPGFTGDFCEIEDDQCDPNPCLNGGTCTDNGLSYTCICLPAFSGTTCNTSLTLCSNSTCGKGGTCVNRADGGTHCICSPGLTGRSCDLHTYKVKQKTRSKPLAPGRPSLHYSLPAHAFHKLLRRPEHELLKITFKETIHAPSPLVTHSQVICFTVLGLLTCLVVLGTTGIIFFNRCETWLANSKYSQLVQQQRDYLLKTTNDEDHSINIILPEKIKLSNYGKHYTSV